MEWSHQKGSISVLHHTIYHHLFSRHTKESILNDNHLPELEEFCKFIHFHPQERVLYEAATMLRGTQWQNQELERALCSGAFDKAECGLYKSWRRKLYGASQRTWSLRQPSCTHKRFKGHSVRSLLDLNQRNGRRVVAHLERTRDRIDTLRAKDSDDLKKKEQREIALWDEGIAIFPSILDKLEQNIDGVISEFEADIASQAHGGVLLKIMRKYGSKQAFLIQFVHQILEDPDHRIIIFSLFGQSLRTLKDRLKMVGVEAGLCRGNVFCRNKAMRAFQGQSDRSDGHRVILLSSKDAASGADLKFATHIILVDPVPGSASESFAAERQAIGRAVRQGMDQRGTATKVIRLVVRDTIEQETHDRNERVRELQNVEDGDSSRVLAAFHGLKMEDRTADEMDFFVNIRESAGQSVPSLSSNDSTTQSVAGSVEEESSDAVYCVCRGPHQEGQFMIQCDFCEEWYHGECIGITEQDAEGIDEYECSLCSKNQAKLSRKRTRNEMVVVVKVKPEHACSVGDDDGDTLEPPKKRRRVRRRCRRQ